jgi:uncharacterized protein YlzI (FlbEa/FlbD family)
MLKLTTFSGHADIVLNPAHIASVRGIPRQHGSAITMANGKEHEVSETVEQVHKMIEDLRYA